MKFKWKRLLCLLLSAISVFALVACGPKDPGSGDDGGDTPGGSTDSTELTEDDYAFSRGANKAPSTRNYTTIKIQAYDGGAGIQWLYNEAKRFQKKYANTSFEEGKTGIYVQIDNSQPQSSAITTSGYHIFYDERFSDIYDLSNQHKIVDISDVLTDDTTFGASIESRVYNGVIDGLKGPDGKYYALPNYALYPSITYSPEVFRVRGWFLAKPDTTENYIETDYGTAEFTIAGDPNPQKSMGPDMCYGTDDDGLPASLEEFMIVCGKIKQDGGDPFVMSGQWRQYGNYLVEAIWTAMAGYEEMSSVYNFNGNVAYISGWTNDNLFTGIDYLKVPQTTTEKLTSETGYRAWETAARYYATAFLEIIEKESWFSAEATGSAGDTDAMGVFLNDVLGATNPSKGFLIEGNYWFNKYNLEYPQYFDTWGDPDIAIAPMPTVLRTADVEEQAEPLKYTTIDNASSYAYINANITNPDIIDACKLFLKFTYTERELRAWTTDTGLIRPLEYNLTEDDMNGLLQFQKSSVSVGRNSDVVYFSSSDPVFKANQSSLRIHFSSKNIFQPFNSQYMNTLDAIRAGKSAREIVENTAFGSQVWATYLSNAGL